MTDENGEVETELLQGDCMTVLDKLEADSVHAIVTDPPYNFDDGFRGQKWDDIGTAEDYQRFNERWSKKAMRVLKPGGHLLSFSSDQTFHRMFTGVEDAGYTIRGTLLWLHGEGFPKGDDISKKIDKKNGAERYTKAANDDSDSDIHYATGPVTEEAKRWDGFNTQLKPAFEPVTLARAPLSENSITNNVLEHGTGALNIGGCRLATGDVCSDGHVDESKRSELSGNDRSLSGEADVQPQKHENVEGGPEQGRYPANVMLDEQAAEQLDEQSGTSVSRVDWGQDGGFGKSNVYADGRVGLHSVSGYNDEGGASRFFYTSKASKSERTVDGAVENTHPTVKPIDLMEWLVRLVTAEGQTVLDPFMGSGTTQMACYNTGRDSIGIEADEKSFEIAEQRIEANGDNPESVGSYPDHIINDPLDV